MASTAGLFPGTAAGSDDCGLGGARIARLYARDLLIRPGDSTIWKKSVFISAHLWLNSGA
jgi:hypothetical protein